MKIKSIFAITIAAAALTLTSCATMDNLASKLDNISQKAGPKYTLPASYDEAYSYRTNSAYKEIVSLVRNKTLDSLRTSNPSKYVQEACSKISELAKNDFEKTKMAHDFVAVLVSYDAKNFWAGTVPAQDFANVLKTKFAVCEGYSNTLKKFLDTLKISCEIVHGYARGVGTSPASQENPKASNHAWNIVKINGEHYLVDCTWDSGHMEGRVSKQAYNTDWLFVKPEHFIYSHFPDSAKKQLLDPPVSTEEFTSLPDFRPVFFDITNGANVPNKIQNCGGVYTWELEAKDGYKLSFAAGNVSTRRELQDRILTKTIDEKTSVTFSLPESGDYEVQVFYWKQGSKSGAGCGSFVLRSNEGSDILYPTIFPNSGKNAYIVEPLEMPLKKGETQKFSVHVENKKFVAVICGREFIQLESDENGNFTGEIEIPQNIKELSIAISNSENRGYEGLARYKVE